MEQNANTQQLNPETAGFKKTDYEARLERFFDAKAREFFGANYGDTIKAAPTADEIVKSATNVSGNSNFWPAKQYAVDLDPLGRPRSRADGHKTKSYSIDPNYNMMNWAGGRLKPSSISFSTLRLMSYKCAPIRAIINTRINQVSQIEWDIKLKNSEIKPNIIQQEKIDYVKNILEHPADNKRKRLNWNTFIKALIEDSLAIDAMAIEKVNNRRGLLKELYPVDGSTIYPNMNEYGEYDEGEAYLQMIRGMKVASFKMNEMVYGIRRPRTDVYAFGYGMSELETIIDTVTSILFVDKYNRGYFSNNSIPEGVLSLAGEIDPQDLEAFKRYWISEVKGIENFWKMPIVNVPDKAAMNWIPFKGSNREMQFNIYYDWLIRIAAGVYQIDPSEINVHGQPGVGQGGHSGGTVAKIEYSKDKGLRDIVEFVKSTINDEIVRLEFPELMFTWTGIDAMTKPERIELRSKELQSGLKTVNEFRKEDHLESLPWGDMSTNPSLNQIFMQQKMMEQQQKQAQAGGQGGQPGQKPGMDEGGGEPAEMEPGEGQGEYMPPEETGQEPGMAGEGETEDLTPKTHNTRKIRVQDEQLSKRKLQGTKASVIDEIQRRNIPPNTMVAAKPIKKSIQDNGDIRIRFEI